MTWTLSKVGPRDFARSTSDDLGRVSCARARLYSADDMPWSAPRAVQSVADPAFSRS